MERNIGKLGLSPITAINFGHGGNPGPNGGPEYYLGDKLNLNIVYSVYHEPKTKEEIAEELGVTLVYIEDKIDFLERNEFLVKTKGDRFTTYVNFSPETFSLEFMEKKAKKQLEIAEILAVEYVPLVRKAVADIEDVYIPGGNRELFEAAAIFCGVTNYCGVEPEKQTRYWRIHTTDGGDFSAFIEFKQTQSDPEYKPTLDLQSYWACGNMNRWSEKYPAVYAWSLDSKHCSRSGGWKNNLVSDYEYLYEFMNGMIRDDAASADKFSRLRQRKFLTDDNKVNIMVMKGDGDEFFKKLPRLDEDTKKKFANFAFEFAMKEAQDYPPQIRDMVIDANVRSFISREVAIMVMDELYNNGTFRMLTENEKITSDLIMFCDILP